MRLRVFADPCRELLFVNFAGRDGEHRHDAISIDCNKSISVESQKELDRNECATLVAVDERMVARNAVAVRRSKIRVIRRAVRDQIPGPRKRRLQQSGVTRAGATAML